MGFPLIVVEVYAFVFEFVESNGITMYHIATEEVNYNWKLSF